MKRRDFLKITMGTLGAGMSIAAAKADVPILVKANIPPLAKENQYFGPSIVSMLKNEIAVLPVKRGPDFWSQDLLNKFYRDFVDNMSLSKDLLNGKS